MVMLWTLGLVGMLVGAPGSEVKGTPAAATQVARPASVEPAAGAPAATAPAASEGEVVTLPAHPTFGADKIVPAKILKKADGSLLIDGKYRVTGAGTEADPYKVPWEMVISAQDTYKPRLGQTKIPQRVVMLDGKHVVLSGYVAFPITAQSPKEMLVMLNQWDGCCIGTPPTAYDAIEVHLKEPAPAAQRLATHGLVSGKFKVDPYVDNGWLLGLYLMEDGKLTLDN